MMFCQPEIIETGVLAENGKVANLVQDVAIVASVTDIPRVGEVTNFHRFRDYVTKEKGASVMVFIRSRGVHVAFG